MTFVNLQKSIKIILKNFVDINFLKKKMELKELIISCEQILKDSKKFKICSQHKEYFKDIFIKIKECKDELIILQSTINNKNYPVKND